MKLSLSLPVITVTTVDSCHLVTKCRTNELDSRTDGSTEGSMDRWLDERMNGRMNGRMNERMDGRTDGRMAGQQDIRPAGRPGLRPNRPPDAATNSDVMTSPPRLLFLQDVTPTVDPVIGDKHGRALTCQRTITHIHTELVLIARSRCGIATRTP